MDRHILMLIKYNQRDLLKSCCLFQKSSMNTFLQSCAIIDKFLDNCPSSISCSAGTKKKTVKKLSVDAFGKSDLWFQEFTSNLLHHLSKLVVIGRKKTTLCLNSGKSFMDNTLRAVFQKRCLFYKVIPTQ